MLQTNAPSARDITSCRLRRTARRKKRTAQCIIDSARAGSLEPR
jgi:hypothetical protein